MNPNSKSIQRRLAIQNPKSKAVKSNKKTVVEIDDDVVELVDRYLESLPEYITKEFKGDKEAMRQTFFLSEQIRKVSDRIGVPALIFSGTGNSFSFGNPKIQTPEQINNNARNMYLRLLQFICDMSRCKMTYSMTFPDGIQGSPGVVEPRTLEKLNSTSRK